MVLVMEPDIDINVKVPTQRATAVKGHQDLEIFETDGPLVNKSVIPR